MLKGTELLYRFSQDLFENFFTNSKDISDAESYILSNIGLDQANTLENYNNSIAEWKLVGDDSSNWQTITANANCSIGGILEKLQNSQDAITMKNCYDANIDPTSSTSPQSPEEAVSHFYGIDNCDWGSLESKLSTYNDILLVMDNHVIAKDVDIDPNISVFDRGCGVYPSLVKNTFCDNKNSNKNNIKSTGGKFSAGGWAGMNFMSGNKFDTHGAIQVIVTKACPSLADKNSSTNNCNNWSVIVCRLFSPEELHKHRIILDAKLPAVCYLTFSNIIPNFPAESISTDHGEVKGSYLNRRYSGWDSMEYGTWVRMFNYDVNFKSGGKNYKDMAHGMGHAIKNGFAKTSYPIHGYQPLKDAKLQKHLKSEGKPLLSKNNGLCENPTLKAYGFISLLNYDANVKGSKQNKIFYKNGEYKYPITTNIKTDIGSCKVSAWILSDPPKTEGKNGTLPLGGDRGIKHSIGNQFQQKEPSTSREWQTGIAQENIIVTCEYDQCNQNVQGRISSVDRNGFRNESILDEMRTLQKQFVVQLPPLIDIKREKSKEGTDCFKRHDKLDGYFNQKLNLRGKAKGNKGICVPTDKDNGNCKLDTKRDLSKLNDDKITQIELLNRSFEPIYDPKTKKSKIYKKVNLNEATYRIQFDTDASDNYLNDLPSDFFTYEESPIDQDVWTLCKRGISPQATNGVLTLTLVRDKNHVNRDKYKERIRFNSGGKSFQLEWNCIIFSKKVGKTNSVEGNRKVSSFANKDNNNKSKSKSKGVKRDIQITAIAKNEVSGWSTQHSASRHSDDTSITMTENDLIGFKLDKDFCHYAVNTDHKQFIAEYKRISKNLQSQGFDTADPKFVEDYFLSWYKHCIRYAESAIQKDIHNFNEKKIDDFVVSTKWLTYNICAESHHLEVFITNELSRAIKGQSVGN